MSGLRLRLRPGLPPLRVDVSDLTPRRVAGLSVEAVARLGLRLGRKPVAVGDLFDVAAGDPERIVFEGDASRLDGIGASLDGGAIRVEGDAGMRVGAGMSAGEISVGGSVGALAACAMSGGSLRVEGSVGDFLGAAMPGEHRGMRGGVVRVGGRAGDRAGDHMRRGLILIEGECGDYCGSRMGGGTIAMLGACGALPGYAMRRGSLLLCGPAPSPPPTFNDCGEVPLGFLALLVRGWRGVSPRFDALARNHCSVRRWVGDLGFGGQGELLHWPER